MKPLADEWLASLHKLMKEERAVERRLPEVRVSDSGRGIPADMHEKIFDQFQQVEANDGKSLRGSGLGLAIAKAIVEHHHGSIGVESEPDRGSAFACQ